MYPVSTPEVGQEGRRNMPDLLGALRRGMRMRLIVHTSMMDDPLKAGRIREMQAAGALYRVTDEPVQQMLVFDRSVVFTQITPVAHTPGALVIRQQSLIAAFIDLFEKTWARSREATETAYRLTPREREVLALIAEGRSNSAVARALSITEAAVGKHVAGVFTKLGLPSTEDDNRRVLAVLAYLRGSVQ
ncbi:helix-turn-helix transcriptional regulator [Planomonospora sp. ID67723]|nr:helix-turn-helix transcriptional regulator [Planomonospora sp. ID67723]